MNFNGKDGQKWHPQLASYPLWDITFPWILRLSFYEWENKLANMVPTNGTISCEPFKIPSQRIRKFDQKRGQHTNLSQASCKVLVFVVTLWCSDCSSLNKLRVSSTYRNQWYIKNSLKDAVMTDWKKTHHNNLAVHEYIR